MKPRIEISFTLYQQKAFLFGKPYCPTDNEILLNHARSGILLALQALHLPAKSGVGVMAYNCHTVFNAVSQAGFIPVFLDVNNDLTIDLNDLRKKRNQLKALIVSHLFGICNRVTNIKKEFPDLFIIEDCAHAYGIERIEGDFAVFSIGQGKFPSIGDGGILVVNNPRWSKDIKHLYSSLPHLGSFQSFRLFLTLLVKSILYKPLVYSIFTAPVKRRRGIPSGIEAIRPSKMNNRISAVYNTECHKVNGEITARQKKAIAISNQLTKLAGCKLLPLGINAFMLVVYCEDKVLAKKWISNHGLETGTHFFHCIDWAKQFGYHDGDCPNVESLRLKLLMIPTY